MRTQLCLIACLLAAVGCPTRDVDRCAEDPTRPGCADDAGPDAGDAGRSDGGGDPDAGDAGGLDAGSDAGDAAPGDAGPDAGPCGPCEGAEPHCDVSAGTCVECLEDEHCGGTTPLCDPTSHTCVECLGPDECTTPEAPRCESGGCSACEDHDDCAHLSGTPACDTGTGECVECTGDAHCGGSEPRCDVSAGTCVECLAPADCPSATASRCDTVTYTCEPCSGDADCSHVSGLDRCDTSAGTCVECTPPTEATDCGDYSCDPATNTCTTTERGSVRRCGACLADTECQNADDRCVPMEFMGTAHGAYCLKRTATGCPQPFMVPTPSRTSLSGASPEQYCGVNEDLTSCEAVLDLLDNQACADASDCGAATLDDGICDRVNFSLDDRCTYACSGSDSECPTINNCSSGYCGGP